jgi:hypothetical protein
MGIRERPRAILILSQIRRTYDRPPVTSHSSLDVAGGAEQRWCYRSAPRSDMRRSKPAQPERNAGAFLGPDMLVPVPLRTLSDDYSDVPVEPEDAEREPMPESPGLLRRLRERLVRRTKPRP